MIKRSQNKERFFYEAMYIGDSITVGTGTSQVVGWRPLITTYIRGKVKLPVKIVGTYAGAAGGDPRISGFSGFRVDELYSIYTTLDVTKYNVKLCLIHAGTNDCTQRNSGAWLGTEQDTLNSMTQILDIIRFRWPACKVVLCKIIPNTNAAVDTLITSLNSAYATLVSARSDASSIGIADMNAAFTANPSWATDYMTDATHPNYSGYQVMANTYQTSIDGIL